MTPRRAALRVVVAEDEAIARAKLVRWITAEPDLALVAEAADGLAAARALDRERPDLVFLDVRMPGLSGLEVLARAGPVPFVIFTTAFDQFAVSAFEVDAVDYLLKPFGPTRFREALERVRKRRGPPTSKLEPRYLEALFALERGRIVKVPVTDVRHFEARDDYVAAWSEGGRRLLAMRLSTLADQLDPAAFVRVHRSHIVRVGAISTLVRIGSGRYRVVLDDGQAFATSRAGGRRLRALRSGDLLHVLGAPSQP